MAGRGYLEEVDPIENKDIFMFRDDFGLGQKNLYIPINQIWRALDWE
jgi:hypothetical protein